MPPDPTAPAGPLDRPYDAKAVEAEAQALWERERVHAFDPDSTAPVFSVDTPPPTVSGSLHVGHVFSYTQAECVVRYQRMLGKNVFYPFGFDGNGLPTERLTEQEHGVRGRDMPRPDFVRLCLETSRKYEREFESLWRSLGFSADWSLVYSTIDERCMRISQRGFLDLWKKGEAYLKESPTLWCTQCGTALAQADLESKEKPSSFTTLRFDLEGGGAVEVATTRPELLPACAAVFLHPTHADASTLVGKRAQVPLQDRSVPVMADDRVDPEKGTGVVMCCTFGDKTDVEWFQKHGLPLRQAIQPTGRMAPIAGPESGLFVSQARKAVLGRLGEAGHVVASREIVHPVATHERCGTDVQFLSTRQVFVRILDKKADLVALGERVRWFPDHMGKRYRNWVENLEWDWCVSRQRFFGVPFPFWHCRSCGEVTLARDEDLPVDPTVREPHAACAKCGKRDFEPERDVMDTWATSSETPQVNARSGDPPGPARCPLPMDLRPQAHDIIRTWAFYTILKSWIHHRDLPWRDAMISGHVQAPGKVKVSKSKGNAPADPNELVAKHGADATRWWALSARLGTDYVFSDEDLASGRSACVKLWNAARLVASTLEGFDARAPRAQPSRAVDRWILARARDAARQAGGYLDAYEFGLAKKAAEDFFRSDLCDNWLEMAKGRLYDRSPEGSAAREEAQAVAYDALQAAVRMLAPFVPHVAEAVHQALFREREGIASVARAPWPERASAHVPPGEDRRGEGALAVAVLTLVRRWRSERKVSPGKAIPRARLTLAPDAADTFRSVEPDVRSAGRVEALEVLAASEPQAEPAFEVVEPPA